MPGQPPARLLTKKIKYDKVSERHDPGPGFLGRFPNHGHRRDDCRADRRVKISTMKTCKLALEQAAKFAFENAGSNMQAWSAAAFGFQAGAEWAVNHLRETGQLIEWHPYPETKPASEGYYLVTLRRDDALVMSIFFINRFPAGTTAWAHLPAPAKKSEQ